MTSTLSSKSWRILSRTEAEVFLHAGDHDVFHLPAYVEAGAAETHGSALYFLYQSLEGEIFLPLIERAIGAFAPDCKDLISPYGYPGPLVRAQPTIDAAALLNRGLAAFARSMDAAGHLTAFIRSHPTLSPLAAGQACDDVQIYAFQTGDVVLVDLAPPIEQIYAGLRRDHRSNIKRLESQGFIATNDSDFDYLDAFIELYAATMRRVQAADHYYFQANFFSALRQAAINRVQLIVVRCGEDLAAAGLFLLCGQTAHYFLSGTAESFLRSAPSKLLVRKGIEQAKEAGCRWLNLGGGLGGRADALFDFKRGFSKLTAPYQTMRLVANRALYETVVARSGADMADPASCQSGFPAYRQRA